MKKLLKISNLKYVAAFLLPLIFVMLINQWLDNDSWYVLAEGRHIVNNGVYYTDVLSMHEGLDATVQNYGFAVIFWLIYSTFGPAGIYVGMLALNFVLCFLLYKICMLISDKNRNASLLIMVVTDCLLALSFVVTRAQMVSYVIFLGLILCLELYVKTGRVKYLLWAPLLSLLQINLHASLWWMLILAMLTYVIDSVRIPRLHLQGYRTKPLVLIWIITILVGLVNPYGLRMITVMFTSYGDTTFKNLVTELSSFSPLGAVWEAMVYMAIVAVLILYIFGKGSRIRIRYLLMFFGFLALGLNTVKGMSQFILVMFFPLALMHKDVKIEEILDAKLARNAVIFWSGIIIIGAFAASFIVVVPRVQNYPDLAIVEAIDKIDETALESGEKLKVYSGYNDGGYIEYRGYGAYLDPRGEYFLKKNNGKEDILEEWVKFKNGKMERDEFLRKYAFDYLIVRQEDDPFYDFNNEQYEKIYENKEYSTEVYRKVANE